MASRKDQKAELRAEREQREREAAAAEKRKRTVGYAVGGLLAAAAVIAILAVLLSGGGDDGGSSEAGSGDWPKGSIPAAQQTDPDAAIKAASCTVKSPKEEGNKHVDGEVTYRANPPTSGDHFIEPAADGAYLEAPRKEQTMHTLEHSRIAIQFKPTVPDTVKGNLKALFDEDPYHMIIFPNQTNMPFAVAATAWNQQLTCNAYNDKVPDAIRAFKNQYRDRGPEQVP